MVNQCIKSSLKLILASTMTLCRTGHTDYELRMNFRFLR
jgi:hypothetical protein